MKNLVQIPTMLVLFNKLNLKKILKSPIIAAHILGKPGLGRELCKVSRIILIKFIDDN